MIDCICINADNKPAEIPTSHWIEHGKEYKVIMIYNMVMQNGTLGVDLQGIDLDGATNGMYSCFKMDRFAFKLEDLDALIKMAEDCAELNDFNVEELLTEQLELVPLD